MTEVHPSDERLIDVALNDLDSRDRDALTAHLASCDACRMRYSGIADSVDGVLAAAPSIVPPPGFTSATLQAMGLDPTHVALGPTQLAVGRAPLAERPAQAAAPAAPSQRRWHLLAAAAAVLALLAGVVGAGTAVILREEPETPVATAPAGAPLVTAAGENVGAVQTARYDRDRVLVISVEGPPGKKYDCRVQMADGSQKTLASWTLPPDGSATWVVDQPAGQATRMDLVAPTGQVWASADL